MASTAVNPDLVRERENATFDVDQLTYFLYDGPANTRRKRYLQNAVIQDFAKHKFKPIAALSQEGQYEQALRRFTLASELEESLALKNPREISYFREAVSPQAPVPFGLHVSMFMDVINRQASEEQKKKWLPLAKSFRMIGTYAQTEMGHGTFLRGLETTATYDPKTKEFVLHSPTVSSTKYWPGGLGKTVNCCILMANLITKGENHGMHPFLVQIRDFETHQPLPGVTVGDIGPKFGFNTVDNGFLRLNQVRIPLSNMFMRYSQVLEDGTYIKPKNTRLTYGSMTMVRTNLVGGAARSLAIAVTIAVRYSAVRRQSEIEPGAGEVQVLDFQTQQMKLLPLVAAAYALNVSSRNVTRVYLHTVDRIEKGALDDLPQLHALSAGLKALSAWEAAEGLEQCRLACGGHGFSHASGIPKVYGSMVPYITLEGENTVMMLQTARYLVKCQRSLQRGEPLPSLMSYLKRSPVTGSRLDGQLHLPDIVDIYEHRAARLVRAVSDKLEAAAGRGEKPYAAWNNSSVELVQAATAHVKAYVVKSLAETVSTMTGKLRTVVEKLCQLYSVVGILASLGDFLEDGYVSSQQSAMLRERLLGLLADLRPDAVALVDAFDFPDAVLDSALGRWDGQVYDALYDWSLNSAMNEKQVLDTYHRYQRPFMEAQWAKTPQVLSVSRL
ncbi:peroxisomal acyl-coenzyme A oxidase 1-like [Babylonia areolata]|uniref:peroxisomal acyl-coenzyme A oxidase 1-like n=1 Tax=Babylonia areolata TaxID=304850 RepID=UPI003FD43F0C